MDIDKNLNCFEQRTYKVEEIQKILRICKNTAYSLIRQRQFHSVKFCGVIRISKKSFDEWLEQGGKQCQL